MPPVRFLPGTRSPATPSVYTDAQWAAMNDVYQTELRLRYRAAKPEYVNKVMLFDGSISDDLAAVRAACVAAEAKDQADLQAFVEANTAALADATSGPSLQAQLNVLRNAAQQRWVKDLDDHLAQQRFLIIVDCDLVPRIWFQCAVPGNPDVEILPDNAPVEG